MLPKAEPKPVGDLAEKPDWLHKGGAAQAVVCDGRLTVQPPPRGNGASDVGALVHVKTKATIEKDDRGVPTASPNLNIINAHKKYSAEAASALGFTPVSRPRIYAGAGAPDPAVDARSGMRWPSVATRLRRRDGCDIQILIQ